MPRPPSYPHPCPNQQAPPSFTYLQNPNSRNLFGGNAEPSDEPSDESSDEFSDDSGDESGELTERWFNEDGTHYRVECPACLDVVLVWRAVIEKKHKSNKSRVNRIADVLSLSPQKVRQLRHAKCSISRDTKDLSSRKKTLMKSCRILEVLDCVEDEFEAKAIQEEQQKAYLKGFDVGAIAGEHYGAKAMKVRVCPFSHSLCFSG